MSIKSIEGKITLSDGSVSEFCIMPGKDGNWSQWGADRDRLYLTVSMVETMRDGLAWAGLLDDESGVGE